MRFGAILSVLSLGLVAIAAPTAYVQEAAVARSAPVDLAVRSIVAPAVSYEKRAESIVVARAAVDDFMAKLNDVNSQIDSMATSFKGQAQKRSALSEDDFVDIFASITAQLNILADLFADVSLLGLINIHVVASICANIFINVAVILHAAVIASVDVQVHIDAVVAILTTICGHFAHGWEPLCEPFYGIIHASVYADIFVALGIHLDVLLDININIGLGLGLGL